MKQNNKKSILFLTEISIFTTILGIVSPFTIPIGTIPITLSIFFIFIISIILTWQQTIIVICLYLILGICGLPVFSGATSGIGILLGPTGGYIWSYLIIGFIVSKISHLKNNKILMSTILTSFIGIIICYLFGTIQFSLVCDINFLKAIKFCVIPFIPFDIIKSIVGITIGFKIKNLLQNEYLREKEAKWPMSSS